MHSTQALFLFAFLAVMALAAPTMSNRKIGTHNKSYSIPRVRKTGYVRDPSRAMSRAYRKFGWQMSAPVNSSDGRVAWTDDSESAVDTNNGVVSFVKTAATSEAASTTSSAAAAGTSDDSGEVKATPADNGAEYLSEVRGLGFMPAIGKC